MIQREALNAAMHWRALVEHLRKTRGQAYMILKRSLILESALLVISMPCNSVDDIVVYQE
jgi:hypothetical protein